MALTDISNTSLVALATLLGHDINTFVVEIGSKNTDYSSRENSVFLRKRN